MKILVGADPELFLYNENDNKFISGHEYIPGTKKSPYKMKYGTIQLDGMAAEFNIDPAETAEEFENNINSTINNMYHFIPKHVTLRAVPAVFFDKKYMKSVPEKCLELGCDPDYNAYTGEANPRPDQNKTMRTGSGHVHVGWTSGVEDPTDIGHFSMCCDLARELDCTLGITLAKLFEHYEVEDRRREMYGQAGCFRPKSYGVEYRTPSNLWVSAYAKEVFQQVIRAVDNLIKQKPLFPEYSDDVRQAINTSNKYTVNMLYCELKDK